MTEAVGQGEAVLSHGFLHKEKLILCSIDAVVDDSFICFIFVKEFEFGKSDPYQRIEPMQDSHCREECYVEAMSPADVHAFVGEDGGAGLEIRAVHDYVAAPGTDAVDIKSDLLRLKYGGCLIDKKHPVLMEYLSLRVEAVKKIISEMDKKGSSDGAKKRRSEIEEELHELTELLKVME